MPLCPPHQPGRPLATGAVLAVLALSGCSSDVEGPSEREARDAGQSYGQAIVDNIGSRATVDEMEELCGARAEEEGFVAQGREGAEIDLALAAFIDACHDVVTKE